MDCFFCGENIKTKGANKRKVGGQFAHKVCPGKKSYKRMRREKLKQEKSNEKRTK